MKTLKTSYFILLSFLLFLVSCANGLHDDTIPKIQPVQKIYTNRVKTQVNINFELIAISGYLSGWDENNITDEQYKKDVDTYFSRYPKAVRAIKDEAQFIRTNYYLACNGPAELSTLYSDGFETPLVDIANYVFSDPRLNRMRNNNVLEPYIEALRNFYIDSAFYYFYVQETEKYKTLLNSIDPNKTLLSIVNALNDYYKCEEKNYITLNISLANSYGGYGIGKSENGIHYTTPFYCQINISNSLEFIIHELSHPFNKPLTEYLINNEQIYDYIDKEIKKKTKCPDADRPFHYLDETLNRAQSLVILSKILNKNTFDIYFEWYINYYNEQEFMECKELAEILYKYRDGNYSDIIEFAPELEEAMINLYVK